MHVVVKAHAMHVMFNKYVMKILQSMGMWLYYSVHTKPSKTQHCKFPIGTSLRPGCLKPFYTLKCSTKYWISFLIKPPLMTCKITETKTKTKLNFTILRNSYRAPQQKFWDQFPKLFAYKYGSCLIHCYCDWPSQHAMADCKTILHKNSFINVESFFNVQLNYYTKMLNKSVRVREVCSYALYLILLWPFLKRSLLGP